MKRRRGHHGDLRRALITRLKRSVDSYYSIGMGGRGSDPGGYIRKLEDLVKHEPVLLRGWEVALYRPLGEGWVDVQDVRLEADDSLTVLKAISDQGPLVADGRELYGGWRVGYFVPSTGEYECSLCGASFADAEGLFAHQGGLDRIECAGWPEGTPAASWLETAHA
jgi:hypothetical protein